MKPYVITSPDYNPTSGGIKVMWGLYGWLLAKGVEVYMNRRPPGEVIAIYPEIERGNPVQTDHIVRYVLNVPGVMGGIDKYGNFLPGPTEFPNENVYYFSRLFGRATDDNHYMFLPIINVSIFKDQKKKKRDKTCYLIGKGRNQGQHPRGSIELNREIARDQQALADILNECHTLYCYDNLTAMMECARLCGCAVKYYGTYTDVELEKYEPGINGISVNKKNPLNTEEFREHYLRLIKEFEVKLDMFIEETQ